MLMHLSIFLIFLMSLSVHEFSHATASYFLGDSTAFLEGRISLNPLKHIDIFGTIILPLTLLSLSFITHGIVPVFGYAKPVPIDIQKLSNSRIKVALVALAGPLSNLLIAFITVIILINLKTKATFYNLCEFVFIVNIILASFNLLPIPPLDGSKILEAVLPGKVRFYMEKFSWIFFIVLIILLQTGFLNQVVKFISSLLIQTAEKI